MSIITEKLPEHLFVKGEEVRIYTDFKVWLQFSEILSSSDSNTKKVVKLFNLIFPEKLPLNMNEAFSAMMEFYAASRGKRTSKADKKEPGKRTFDYEYDAELIYAAFHQQYNIDLCEASMHWWKFKALLEGLSEDTHFVQVMQYRNIDIAEIKDKKQKAFYKKMKMIYALPENDAYKESQISSFAEAFI